MKILMLHGYAQNGQIYRHKLRRLESRLCKEFPNTSFAWPDGPLELSASDVPGYEPSHGSIQDPEGLELRAWFHLRYVQDPPLGLSQSLDMLAEVLRRDGPFDGVIAFSQGTIIAAMLASLLQGKSRYRAYEEALQLSSKTMSYPKAFLDILHPPLKFGVLYAGRVGRASYYGWLYESPQIETPFCHFFGLWDPMVEHEERAAVLERLSGGNGSLAIVHAGGHFVPTDNDNCDRLVDFVTECCQERSQP
ncbi:hypothetical protein Q7P37_001712 [Cladosporium fusiforme]